MDSTEATSVAELDYPNISTEVRGGIVPVRLKLRNNDLTYRNTRTGVTEHLNSAELHSVTWMHRARGPCLRVQMKEGKTCCFDGFSEEDFAKVSDFVKANYSLELKKADMSVKGWNWGSLKFTGDSMDFLVEDKLAFEIPLHNVSNASQAKNELVMEFHQNDDAEVCLSEMRFYMPQVDTGENLAETVYKKIMKRADIIQVTGTAIVEFKDLQCMLPRGRYDIKLYPTFMHMHGKTFDYKVPFTTLQRMFLLQHPDQRVYFFILNLDPPLKHGQTRYQFIILSFDVDAETTVELRLSQEELTKKYNGNLTSPLTGSEFEVVAQIFKVLSGKRISGEGSFESKTVPGAHAIGCGFKAQTGLLYPLERSFLFIPRPGVNIRYDEINYVNFSRGDNAMKTFDLEVETRGSVSFTFSSIPKAEYHRLYDFITQKNLPVKNTDDGGPRVSREEDWSSESENDLVVHDAYKERVKQEGRSRAAADRAAAASSNAAKAGGDDEDDSDDEDADADFNPDGADGASDVDEEYDSQVSYKSSSDDSEGDGEKKKKKHKKEHKHKKHHHSSDEEMSSEASSGSASPPPKKAKKPARETKEPKKSKGDKAAKDPNAPKRPGTAYLYYVNQNREAIKASLGSGAGIAEVGKAAGERWNKMSEEEKRPYVTMQNEAKTKYEAAMKEYKEKVKRGEIVPPKAGEGKKQKASAGSSKAASGKSATTAAATGNYKSQEYVESSESTSVSSGDDSISD